MNIVVSYTLFALIAIIVNITAQDIFLKFYHSSFAMIFSILFGTFAGLIIKYWLDKNFIFRFIPKNIQQHGKVFILYTLMGVITTLIFWSVEIVFELIFQSKEIRYLGGVIGLIIGYIIKYYLDKKYVFSG